MKVSLIAFATLLVWQATSSVADVRVLPDKVSDAELGRLPDFCQVRMKTPWNSPESRAWRSRIGENYGDFFHYCSGLNYLNRYWAARTDRERNYYLERAEANFNYIERDQQPDFTMGSELYSNRGEVYKLQGKAALAAKDFIRSMTIDPTNTKPYLQLADLYLGNREHARARETITEGLRHVPDSKALQRKYLDLGGKEPFPEPVAKKKLAPESAAQQAAETAPAAEAAARPAPLEAVGATPETKAETPPAIGTPKNPYCRFCPPE